MKVISLNEYLYMINEYKSNDCKQLFITFITYILIIGIHI